MVGVVIKVEVVVGGSVSVVIISALGLAGLAG